MALFHYYLHSHSEDALRFRFTQPELYFFFFSDKVKVSTEQSWFYQHISKVFYWEVLDFNNFPSSLDRYRDTSFIPEGEFTFPAVSSQQVKANSPRIRLLFITRIVQKIFLAFPWECNWTKWRNVTQFSIFVTHILYISTFVTQII